MSLAIIKDNLAINLASVSGVASSALDGTVAKVAGNTTITGTGTLFRSKLRIGSIISIPGTAVEYFAVAAIASDTSLTVTIAATYSATVQTATLYSVFGDNPSKAPENAQCPAIIIAYRDPAWSTIPLGQGLTQYTWNFQIRLCLYSVGVETQPAREQAIEPYPALIRAKLNANNSLQSAAKSVKFASIGKIGYFNYMGIDFYGLTYDLDVFENVSETYAA